MPLGRSQSDNLIASPDFTLATSTNSCGGMSSARVQTTLTKLQEEGDCEEEKKTNDQRAC
jgi:hypothetical protein